MTRVLVCGPRNYGEIIIGKTSAQAFHERMKIYDTLSEDHERQPITILVHGACMIDGRLSGADHWADEWALDHDVQRRRYPVDHALDGPWPAAGPRRNRRMRDESKPERGIAFMPPPGTKKSGTLGMVKLMEDAGLNVLKVPE